MVSACDPNEEVSKSGEGLEAARAAQEQRASQFFKRKGGETVLARPKKRFRRWAVQYLRELDNQAIFVCALVPKLRLPPLETQGGVVATLGQGHSP